MSVTFRLPDGSKRDYSDASVTPYRVAEDISPRLAKAAVAAVVDGKPVDVTAAITEGEHELKLLTDRDEAGLEVLRHTAAHVLAQAVVRLYGKEVKYTIGPALMDDFQYGFYYDFDLPAPIGQEDLPKIEAEMQKIVEEKIATQRVEFTAAAASEEMTKLGQGYKVEMIDDLLKSQRDAGILPACPEGVSPSSAPADSGNSQEHGQDAHATHGRDARATLTISLYRQGDFLDMCRGPHLPHTGMLKAFKLLTTAGAYWRGDDKNKMLTRIYGVAFFDKKQLDEHLVRIEEARKRDHRVIGKQLGLFLISDAVGQGLPLWLPKGAVLRGQLQGWLQQELTARGYQMVVTPHIGKLDLWKTSGHYPYYKDSQYPPIALTEDEQYLLKPMNCPGHVMIYKAQQHSYRDLPLRLAEFGTVYRMEQSGELNGLVRVRGFTQDDAHIFCTPEQLESEVESCVDLVKLVLGKLGLNDYRVRIGLRDPKSDKYVGDPQHWEMAQDNLRHVVTKLGLPYTEEEGEAAFYGPKIDFVVRDCIGRQWQLGTIQVDYNLPERFELEYIGADNRPHRPVMVHRAPFGSMERFIGILIEHFAGAFPLWLAPVQVAVLPVSDKYNDYGREVLARLKAAGVRAEMNDSPEKIGAKIRTATLEKVPYMLVLGQREQESQTVSLRHRTEGDKGAMGLEQFLDALQKEIETKEK